MIFIDDQNPFGESIGYKAKNHLTATVDVWGFFGIFLSVYVAADSHILCTFPSSFSRSVPSEVSLMSGVFLHSYKSFKNFTTAHLFKLCLSLQWLWFIYSCSSINQFNFFFPRPLTLPCYPQISHGDAWQCKLLGCRSV